MIAQERADDDLVRTNQEYQGFAHRWDSLFQCPSRDRRKALLSASATTGRHITTMSSPCVESRRCLKLSRINRFTRLRSTARRNDFFEIANPNLDRCSPLGLANTVKKRSADRSGRSKTRRNSSALTSRRERGKALSPSANDRRSGGQAGTPLGAPGLDDLAATAGCHSCPKTMGPRPFESTGLKCSFHVSVTLPPIGEE